MVWKKCRFKKERAVEMIGERVPFSVTDKKENEDDIKVAGGWISLSDFNKMKKEQNSRFNATMRRMKIQRVIEKIFDSK